MAETRTYTPDTPVYFPDLGKHAWPGDTVTVDADGVVTAVKTMKGRSETSEDFDHDTPAEPVPADIEEPSA